MRGLNKVMLIGRLGKNPDTMVFESGVKKTSFAVATNESFRDKEGNKIEKTDWHNIVCWRGVADVADKYLKKGSRVYVEGKLKTRSWDDKDGNKKYITEVEVSDLHLLDYISTGNQGNDQMSKDAAVVDNLVKDEAGELFE